MNLNEFYTGSHIFDTCIEAMRFLMEQKKVMKWIGNPSYTEWTHLANNFLALGKQCELSPTEHFEHYPRLSKDMAREVLEIATHGMNENARQEFIKSYIDHFDLNCFMHHIR